MELKTIQTPHVPVRYYEGGQGQPLVFLHGAGGLDLDLGFLDALAEKLETAAPPERDRLLFRLAYLRRRSYILDVAVMMATLSGAATSIAALLLFVGTLRDKTGISLFVAFGLALLFTVGALGAFLIEMLLASHGIRDLAAKADEIDESAEPLHSEINESEAESAAGDATPH